MKSKRRKIKVHECSGINIRELSPEYFQVDYMRDGKRERKGYKTLGEAETHCKVIAAKLGNEGTSILNLTPTQREDAQKAFVLLAGKTTLQEAARFWARHFATEDGVSVAELGRRWLVNLKAQGCRQATITEREYKVGSLDAAMGCRPIVGVTRDDLEGYINSKGVKGATWDTYRRALRAMFQYAVDKKLLDYNPAASIKPVKLDEKTPTPLTVDAVIDLMRTVEKYVPIMAPTLAVQFFGGLRPGEAMGLTWDAIDFKQKIIRVTPETSKVRRSRLVDMNQTLIDWLTPYRKLSGPIGIETKSQFSFYMLRKPIGEAPVKGEKDTRKPGIVKAAGVKWIQDGPRKSFATMYFATHGDAGKLAGILGHTGGADVLYRHYRGLATKADARKYWKIRPTAATKANPVAVDFRRVVS